MTELWPTARYEGAVMFADVSGFSALGDVLERRERERHAASHAGRANGAAGPGSGGRGGSKVRGCLKDTASACCSTAVRAL